jgi:hypothetical protein
LLGGGEGRPQASPAPCRHLHREASSAAQRYCHERPGVTSLDVLVAAVILGTPIQGLLEATMHTFCWVNTLDVETCGSELMRAQSA